METIHAALKESMKSDDFIQSATTIRHTLLQLSYYNSIINQEMLHRDLFTVIQLSNAEIHNLNDLKNAIPFEGVKVSSNLQEVSQSLILGFIFVQLDSDLNEGLLINIADTEKGYRGNNLSENEYSVIGPQVAFVEDLDTNLNLLRKEIKSEKLKFEVQIKGSLSKTRVVIAYIEGITNPQHVNTVRQRIMDLDFDVIFDTSTLSQIISDVSITPFPLFMSTERVDRMKFLLLSGNVAVLSESSPFVISGPTTLFDFFYSPEDFYLPWILGSFFRLLRYLGVIFSIFASSIYVSIMTFHYSIVPRAMLGPIIESRMNVPFPPFLEVLLMEMTVELLREAGARLPTKVGQTLGIVGGVVLGEASVQAGLTSNILIIIVSLSALASFTTPIFKMSNTIRFLRFPLIFLAGAWGGLGIVIGVLILLGHLLRLKSLGTPYLVPVFPFRYKGFKEFLRLSYSATWNRPAFLRPLKEKRYSVRKDQDIGDDYKNE
ncbi:spore germination protein [Paenibacillus anseongense]|uniref:spore germination protein n=1 Tax=Paenibacillus anseongense TaxID=2682845 RepID=UPI002DBFC8CC|nr:spore germination protein [Paenibacillus anseongense]MEC0270974.1 spore germination protein [Paenibacillus anseongense]